MSFALSLPTLLQRLQGFLPLNPQGFGAKQATADLSFNTAISFMTNTNWQSYGGETTLSYFVQMVALAVQNFVSAAAGMAVAIALVRGFARQEQKTIGNFWVDVTRARCTSCCRSRFIARPVLLLAGRGSELRPYTTVTTVEGAKQTIAQGPVGVAGSDQTTGDERRRLLQRQLRASVRESRRRFTNFSRCC